MLVTYQKAKTVIAWLGTVYRGINEVIEANSCISPKELANTVTDFWAVQAGIVALYMNPWFRRI
jgi:hypothetical protein